MEAAHDLLRRAQHRHAAGSARRFDMIRSDAAQLFVNFGEERSQMKLPREQAAGKIPDHPCLDVSGIDTRVRNGGLPGLNNDVPNRLALLLEIAFEVGAPGAKDINRLGHNSNPARKLSP